MADRQDGACSRLSARRSPTATSTSCARGCGSSPQAVMEAEVTELTGVPHGERDPEHRLTRRNGYRERRWDTRVGTRQC